MLNSEMTLEEVNASIAKRNAEFEKADLMQRRCILAKEVLTLLDNPALELRRGHSYVTALFGEQNRMSREERYGADGFADAPEVVTVLPRTQKCTVCFLGACVIAAVTIRNHLTLSGVVLEDAVYPPYGHRALSYGGFSLNGPQTREYLSDLFDYDEMAFMERTFERSDHRIEPHETVKFVFNSILAHEGQLLQDTVRDSYRKLEYARKHAAFVKARDSFPAGTTSRQHAQSDLEFIEKEEAQYQAQLAEYEADNG